MGRLDQPWVVSYDAAPEIVRLYDDYTPLRYSLTYSASTRHQGAEVMFLAPGLAAPVDSPASVPSDRVHRVRSGATLRSSL